MQEICDDLQKDDFLNVKIKKACSQDHLDIWGLCTAVNSNWLMGHSHESETKGCQKKLPNICI